MLNEREAVLSNLCGVESLHAPLSINKGVYVILYRNNTSFRIFDNNPIRKTVILPHGYSIKHGMLNNGLIVRRSIDKDHLHYFNGTKNKTFCNNYVDGWVWDLSDLTIKEVKQIEGKKVIDPISRHGNFIGKEGWNVKVKQFLYSETIHTKEPKNSESNKKRWSQNYPELIKGDFTVFSSDWRQLDIDANDPATYQGFNTANAKANKILRDLKEKLIEYYS